MPPKKNSANQPKQVPEQVAVIQEGGDPVMSAISIVDKKVRNLEKRRNKLQTLKETAQEGGEALDRDQQEAITKIKDVNLQLEMVKELQKQFATLQTEHQKYRKRQQRLERVQAKEAEHEAETKAVAYTLRVQTMLDAFGDEDKENFRTGSEGAVKLSEDELSQIDELYKLITPAREDNPNYESDLDQASEVLVQLREGSSKEVVGTTYKGLHEVLDRVDKSGYFDKPPRGGGQDEQESEEEEEEADEFKSADDQSAVNDEGAPPDSGNFTEEVDIPPEVPPVVEAEPPAQYLGSAEVMSSEIAPPPPSGGMNHVLGNSVAISQANSIMNCMPPAPSPTFPALGTSPVLLMHDDGFSFMHESEVDRKQIHSPTNAPFTTSQQITHQAPPTQVQSQLATQKVDYHAQYDNRGGVTSPSVEQEMMSGSVGQTGIQNAATDVTTGQPNPAIQSSYQSTVTGIIGLSAPPPANHDEGGVNPGVGGNIYSNVMPEVPSGYRQQQQQQQSSQNQYYRQNKSGRGTSQGGGGQGRRPQGVQGNYKANYSNNRNGRGMQGQGGYESRGYGGGGYQQRGGRPNYRTSAAGGGGGSSGGGQKRS